MLGEFRVRSGMYLAALLVVRARTSFEGPAPTNTRAPDHQNARRYACGAKWRYGPLRAMGRQPTQKQLNDETPDAAASKSLWREASLQAGSPRCRLRRIWRSPRKLTSAWWELAQALVRFCPGPTGLHRR